MKNAGKIDRIYRRLCQQRERKEDNKKSFLFCHCTSCCFSQLTSRWSPAFCQFLRNERKRRTEENESKSTVNNRTRCQLPYQINLPAVVTTLQVSSSACFSALKTRKNFYNLLRRTQRFVNNPQLMFSSFFLLLMRKLHKTFMFHSLLNNSFGINSLYDISVTLSDGRMLSDGEYMTKSVHE